MVLSDVKVMVWKKDKRKGVVVRGAGVPEKGGGTARVGGRVPEGAEVEYLYRSGYDSRCRAFADHMVDERGDSVMLKQRAAHAA